MAAIGHQCYATLHDRVILRFESSVCFIYEFVATLFFTVPCSQCGTSTGTERLA